MLAPLQQTEHSVGTVGHVATVTRLRVPVPFNIYREVAFRFLDLNSRRASDKKKQEHVWQPLNCKGPSTKAAAGMSHQT